jgi:hypothetical protein
VEILEYSCNLEYCNVLWGESSKCRLFIIDRDILHNYHTHKLVAVNKHLGTYLDYGSILSSQFVQVWEYWCILEYSVVLWGDSSKCRGFKTVRAGFRIYHTDKLVVGNKHLVTCSGQGIYFPPILIQIVVHFSSSSCIATPIDPVCIYGVHLAPGCSIPRLTQSSDFRILRTGLLAPTMPSSQQNEMCLSKRYRVQNAIFMQCTPGGQ